MSDIVNFYSLKGVAKHLDSRADEQRQWTGIKKNSRLLICGASGSGKSNCLLNYLALASKPARGTFKHIFLCYKTDEPLYEYLKDKIKGDITCYKSLESFPEASSFPDQNEDQYLVIIDDCVMDKDRASSKKIGEYFAFGRKKSLTICFLSQSYFDTPTFVRKNINYLLLTSIAGNRDLRLIVKDYLRSNVSVEQLQEMYEHATMKELDFFKIDLTACKLNQKFSRNFTDYFSLEEAMEEG